MDYGRYGIIKNQKPSKCSANKGEIMIQYLQTFIVMIVMFPLMACAGTSITCKVLDEKTKEPIEGAVAIAWWNQTKGFGLTHTITVKIVEEVTDKDGQFTIPAVSVPLSASPPQLKVYKPGYVGWSSDSIYLGYHGDDIFSVKSEKRTNFQWQDQTIYLEKFKEGYSYVSHEKFLTRGLPTIKDSNKLNINDLFGQAINWEIPFRVKERDQLNKKKK